MSLSENNKNWIKKRLTLIVFFLALTPISLVLSIIALFVISKNVTDESATVRSFFAPEVNSVILSGNSSTDLPTITEEIIAKDTRDSLLRSYLKKNKSPLEPYSQYIVEVSDKYHLDYRLLVAIAQKESGLCRVIPENSHNCWGWGIHSKGTLRFDSYEQALDTVAKGLKENYVDKGYLTVEQIMTKYAHSSSTTWAEGVINYMNQIN